MGLIDKNLEKLGFKRWNVRPGKSACYVKMLIDSNGKDSGHMHFVEIVKIGDELYLGSYIKGLGCERGRNCSHPLNFSEYRLFLLKMRWLKISWMTQSVIERVRSWFRRGEK